MNKKIQTAAVDQLFDAILSLRTREECYDFFEDLCTVGEILSMSQRLDVARMLDQHETYLQIAGQTGASTATISRVGRSLNYGNDAYRLALGRVAAARAAAEQSADQTAEEQAAADRSAEQAAADLSSSDRTESGN